MKYEKTEWFIYILRCSDGTLYTGITNNIYRRVQEHNKGVGAKYTKSRSPVVLNYYEKVESKSEALRREYYIKKLTRHEKQLLINFYEEKEHENIQ